MIGDGTIRLTGGYTYSSNTDYAGRQYRDLDDGAWLYDIRKNSWTTTSGKSAEPNTRVYRTGPFHPDFYLAGDEPNAAAFEAWLAKIPVNEWVPTNPPQLPRLNRDWGTARIDPSRDMILHWSGGHSAHGGTDVLHFHLSTNRRELPFPVEFPLGQLYANKSYPNGFNFNLRPRMTGHTYQNYAFDPPSGKMVKAGHPRHFYVYDPDVADWTGRGPKPAAMRYDSCFYTLTLTATPAYDCARNAWVALDIAYSTAKRSNRTTRAFPHRRSAGLMFDARRKLVWGTDANSQVYVLRLDAKTAGKKLLK